MRVTIVGGGNIGTQFAVHCAEKGHWVTIYTSTPEIFDRHLTIVDDTGYTLHEGDILLATDDPSVAFQGADFIIVTLPPTMMKSAADVIYANSSKDSVIGVVPGNGGGECAFRECIERGNLFFGIERVPAIARLVKKGQTVRCIGYRRELHIATLPAVDTRRCREWVEKTFDMICWTIPNYLNLTLTPSNPILHTARLRRLFGDYQPGKTYANPPLFYEEWDDESSKLLFACDEEVQAICRALPEFRLTNVVSLREHYGCPDIRSMTAKISSIPAFKGLTSPVLETREGFVPDLHSRYFTADFSYGLSIIQQIADFAGVDTPNIDATMQWYRSIAVVTDEFRYKNYGITDMRSFQDFYLR